MDLATDDRRWRVTTSRRWEFLCCTDDIFTGTTRQGAQLVVIVNKKLAEQSWPGQDPIGKRLRMGTQTMQTPWATVVGEVADVKENSPDAAAKQQYYITVDSVEAVGGIAWLRRRI